LRGRQWQAIALPQRSVRAGRVDLVVLCALY